MMLCVTELEFFEKTFFAPKVGRMGQKYAKDSFFFNLKKTLVINFTEFVL